MPVTHRRKERSLLKGLKSSGVGGRVFVWGRINPKGGRPPDRGIRVAPLRDEP
jgi:hypothetical protein